MGDLMDYLKERLKEKKDRALTRACYHGGLDYLAKVKADEERLVRILAEKPTALACNSWGEMGFWLHTSLRKSCNSKPTVAMWLLINEDDEKNHIWKKYLTRLYPLVAPPMTVAARREIVSEFSTTSTFDGRGADLMRVLFCMFDEGDWLGYTSNLHGSESE